MGDCTRKLDVDRKNQQSARTMRCWFSFEGAVLLALVLALAGDGARADEFRVAVFSADVTVPAGHGMMGGAWLSKSVADPLEAHGFVLLGGEKPIVYVAVDWCEIRNDAYWRWQEVIAEAAGTVSERVMVSTIHQHDAPVADLEAERILRARNLKATVCDLEFHEIAVNRVAAAVREALPAARRVTHVGRGKARVEQVASNRRYTAPDGSVRFDRMSRTVDGVIRRAPEGLIDPWLRTISFWEGENPLLAMSSYAVHPMSYYGQGEVSADFPGIARRRRQAEMPGVKQIYVTGCAGNITAGKYNDGSRENRLVLAERLREAMARAWSGTEKFPLTTVGFRAEWVRFQARDGGGFSEAELERGLAPERTPFQQCLAAMGLSWRKRAARPISIPCLDLGAVQIVLLPGESYVEYQLAVEARRDFVLVAGYGDGATGYIPTERHIAEGDTNLGDWCWVAPGSEKVLLEAIDRLLPVRSK